MNRYSHCHFCGTAYSEIVWPRVCSVCSREVYNNPTPVALNIQPITHGNRIGLAMAQRAISPHVGGWALIGGHIENNGETVEEGAIREFLEETSRHTGTNPRLVESRANGHGHLLMVVEHDPIEADYFIRGTPCKENLALGILWDARELCFDIHTDLASKWLRKHA